MMTDAQKLDMAYRTIGRLTFENEGLRSDLSRAYLVGQDGDLYHARCGELGVGLVEGKIAPVCSCATEQEVPQNGVDSDSSKSL